MFRISLQGLLIVVTIFAGLMASLVYQTEAVHEYTVSVPYTYFAPPPQNSVPGMGTRFVIKTRLESRSIDTQGWGWPFMYAKVYNSKIVYRNWSYLVCDILLVVFAVGSVAFLAKRMQRLRASVDQN